ncbi:hypothetical protein AGRA3207_001035 [Actinomadura graeca]|uniref:SWIM-type domain-containing protein n=1 Tax=Actinomadura graeca TaxID=2750812 RepID=A0ABX8QNW5_9ACTN|nr:hypothetical protein [Actinomadura graeca]QXJ20341.1 hypothetical protein AGRA3207_001035 [Actinomadura graeca]
MSRADLLALTPGALAALVNRGLVKRAAKDLDAGNGPAVTVAPGGGVHGLFPDGTETTLPPGAGLEAATCTCAATSACRHRVCLVLAYQRDHGGTGGPDDGPDDGAVPEAAAGWSPGAFDDETLARVLGRRALTAARRTFRAGYAARVHRPSEHDPVARVELPSCTVRFLVPGELGYVETDAVAVVRAEVIVLAAWAFRAADERDPDGADVRVDVGGAGGAAGGAAGTGLEAVLELTGQVLLEGAAQAGPVLAAALRRAAADLAGGGLHWPAAAVEELAGQLDAHRDRRADHDPGRLAALLAEVRARHRAARNGASRAQVLGTDESAETPLRRVRLAALGCRVGGNAESRTADVYLAHGDTVLVLKRRWAVPGGERLTGADLAGRRILGTSLRALAAANVVSESATRSAGRVVRVARGRVARTTVTPLGDAWEGLPPALLVRDLAAQGRALDALPPSLVRPRVEAELVRVVAVAEVRDIGYHPGDQRLDAVVADAAGTTAVVSADHAPHRPGALDALAEALTAGPRLISGALRRDRGGLVIDPFAVMTGDGIAVPDLATGRGGGPLDGPSARPPDALGSALEDALAVCAEAAQRGLLYAPRGLRDRVARAGRDLGRVGLRTAGAAVAHLATALGGDDPHQMTRTWADAQIRLITTAERR